MADFNDNLWAPWRMEYIRSLGEEAEDIGCFLCHYLKNPQDDKSNHVLLRAEHTFVVLNRFPYTNGHVMVALNRHTGELSDLNDAEIAEMSKYSFICAEMLTRTIKAQGMNIGTNVGRCAGAGLPDHLHTHIVPRWSGDNNYMAVLGGIRVVPDALDAIYEQLVDTAVKMGLRDP